VRTRRIGLLGVPTSAGSHNAGQERAPQAFRDAGLLDELQSEGLEVFDFGDLPSATHRPAAREAGVRDASRVVRVASQTRDTVAEIAAAGYQPLVVGGDCTITIGVVAGLSASRAVGLLYFDGDADLNTPELSGSGVLDTMGITHLLGGGVRELAELGAATPLLDHERLVLAGFDPGELDTAQWQTLVSQQLTALPAALLRSEPDESVTRALAHLSAAVASVVVHFDVDVIDTGAFPLANFPHFAGLLPEEAFECLRAMCASPLVEALVVTEANPGHDPDGTLVARVVRAVAAAVGANPATNHAPAR
jgi:arginase